MRLRRVFSYMGARVEDPATVRARRRPRRASLRCLLAAAATCLGLTLPATATGSKSSAVSAGEADTCALTKAGGVKCWGLNDQGQLGDGTTTNKTTPVDVSGLTSGVAAVSVGQGHTCALTSTGGVKCWGGNAWGELGDGTTTQRLTPVDVSGLTSGVVAISAGGFHTCALTSTGGVKCWGDNREGELGDGATGPEKCFSDRCSRTPVDVSGLTSGVTAISADSGGTCAVTSTGGAKCWGFPAGDGTFEGKTTPVDVSGLTSGVAAVSVGQGHACALTSAHAAKCWGYNWGGQLGDGTATGPEQCGEGGEIFPCSRTPVAVSGLTSGVAISAGYGRTCALTSGGGAKCWGSLTGDGTDREKTTPVDVSGLTSGVAEIRAGESHTCAVRSEGGVECWGWNLSGQLGDGTTVGPEKCGLATCSQTPIDVSGLTSGTCTTNSGSIKLSPGVTNTPATQTVKIKGLLSGCSGARFTSAKYTATLTTAGPVSCSTLSGTGETASGAATYKWTPKTKPSPGTSTGTLSLTLSGTAGTAFSAEVMNGPESPLAFSGMATESYTGACGTKPVKKGKFSGAALSFE
jgi:alpha-tubulin suppressor-like RCC1 family protein